MYTGPNVFCLEGEYWSIAYDGLVVRLRDRRGLHILAQLLAQPGAALEAGKLVSAGRTSEIKADTADERADERARVTVAKNLKSAIRAIRTVHAALGAHLDATIRCGYRCTYRPDPRVPIAWQRQAKT
jgi:hypothetical protein